MRSVCFRWALAAVFLPICPCLAAKDFYFSHRDFQLEFRARLNELQEGDRLYLPAGHFQFKRGLNLVGKDIAVLGAGADKTILDFTNQQQGAQGISARGYSLVLGDFTVLNAHGDGLVLRDSADVTVQNIKVAWADTKDSAKGGYGIYPVDSQNVQVLNCEARGAIEAGIYVGQSKHALVKGNRVTNNAVGIEIENSDDIVVADNKIQNNSIGLLVTAIPNLQNKETRRVDVERNTIKGNNKFNDSPAGSLAAKLQAGSGLVIVAADTVSVHSNDIYAHHYADVVVRSYVDIRSDVSDSYYNPYNHAIALAANRWGDKIKSSQSPAKIYWDGVVEKDLAGDLRDDKAPTLCIDEEAPVLLQKKGGKPQEITIRTCFP